LFLVLLAALIGNASGRETSFWVTERDSDFRSGTPEHVSVKRPGIVVLAPELDTLLSAGENYFWCLASDKQGTIYAGSGDGGRVYSIDSGGRTAVLMDSLDLEVLSLAVDDRGRVYAGTAPGGHVYRTDGAGKSSVFFETGESYVWCLEFDDEGNLYAGTGDDGKVFRIKPDGEGDVFYETGERHVMCSQYKNGRLVVGTEGTGLVFSIDTNGKARVLYDCDEQEVRDVACSEDGVTYAAAIFRTKKVAGPAIDGATGGAAGDIQEEKEGSSVYRISADGTTSKIWTTTISTVYCLLLVAEDSLLLGTGDDGRIFSLSGWQLELVDKVGDSQLLDLTGSAGRYVFCTGNKARVFSAGPRVSRSGSLVSRVFDTAGISRWGELSWEAETPAGASLGLQLRSGNSETPNKTWSDWSDEVVTSGGVPDAAPGRFVQWRTTLGSSRGGATAALKKVKLAYADKNLAPVVAGIRVLPQGIPFTAGGIERMPERVSQTLPGGLKVEYSAVRDEERRVFEEAGWARSVRTILWESSDQNDDKLSFSLYYRRAGDTRWSLIKEGVEETLFALNTYAWPDGAYELRVVGTDLPGNLPSEALTSEAVSLPFDVDNSPPSVSDLVGERVPNGLRVTATLSDEMSAVVESQYSLDGGEWMMVQSSDGLLDSRREKLAFVVRAPDKGEHMITVRAIDGSGNIGARSVTVRQ
jgi:sugar lactone lactonase YvrE